MKTLNSRPRYVFLPIRQRGLESLKRLNKTFRTILRDSRHRFNRLVIYRYD